MVGLAGPNPNGVSMPPPRIFPELPPLTDNLYETAKQYRNSRCRYRVDRSPESLPLTQSNQLTAVPFVIQILPENDLKRGIDSVFTVKYTLTENI